MCTFLGRWTVLPQRSHSRLLWSCKPSKCPASTILFIKKCFYFNQIYVSINTTNQIDLNNHNYNTIVTYARTYLQHKQYGVYIQQPCLKLQCNKVKRARLCPEDCYLVVHSSQYRYDGTVYDGDACFGVFYLRILLSFLAD